MLQIYTGNGKGKTTAAIGLAIRAIGAGKKVGWICFDKGGTHYSERKVLDAIVNLPFSEAKLGSIDLRAFGLDRIDAITGRFRFGATKEDIVAAEEGLALAREWMHDGKYDLIILDEINSTVDLGMLKKEAALELLDIIDQSETLTKNCPELVFTGRNAPTEFLDRADLITEMTLGKHYFYKGVRAREGFDY